MRQLKIVLSIVLLVCSELTIAQTYPIRPVRLVTPFPASGATDIIARAIGRNLDKLLQQRIVVDNRGGAGGIIGTDIVAKATPDGYTVLMATAANAANACLFKEMPHDFARDLRPVMQVVMAPYMLVANATVPVSSVADIIRIARDSPGKLNYASAGMGSSQHLTGELFMLMAKVQLTHIPYKGTGAAIADLVAGRVQLMFSAIPALMPFIKSGKLRSIAVTSEKRTVGLPDVPTIGESGVPGFNMSGWFGLMVPRGTPVAVIRTLNKAANEALVPAEINKLFISLGLDPVGGSAEEFDIFIRQEMDKYARLVRAANISLQ